MNALDIKNLKKTYKSGFTALHGVDLVVREGEFYGLLGPNGAGKTTTIGIVTSLVTKSSGTVKIFGVDIDQDFPAAKRLIGVVPQEFNFSIFEKVEDIVIQQAGYYGIPLEEARIRSEKYLKKLDLWEKRKVVARELSGGMKRRLMIARGLVHEPKLLILDEPTAGVDVELRRGMWEFLAELNRDGRTIILTTHYLEEAEQLCNRIGIISGGRIIADSSKKELLQRLDKETYVFEVEGQIPELEALDGVEYNIVDSSTLEVTRRKEQALSSVMEHLLKQGIVIESMRNKTSRLEELFMEMLEE